MSSVQSIALPSASTIAAVAPKPTASAKPRRVKIFTVHGTFDNEAPWDDWDSKAADEEKKQGNKYRNFLNRMRDHLSAEGVVFDEMDASQYNWSGYNSHDERLASAIGLKKHIEAVLTKDYEKHGRDYYDGVYVIAHSHGGTIARLAMNLWDKDYQHYKPEENELKHDDHCPHCKQERHGVVGPNTVPRPTRVITFGSPFVTFEPRKGGLLSAQIAVWVFRVVTSIPFLLYFAFLFFAPTIVKGIAANIFNDLPAPLRRPEAEMALLLLVPLLLWWLLLSYGPRRFVHTLERRHVHATVVNSVGAVARTRFARRTCRARRLLSGVLHQRPRRCRLVDGNPEQPDRDRLGVVGGPARAVLGGGDQPDGAFAIRARPGGGKAEGQAAGQIRSPQ